MVLQPVIMTSYVKQKRESAGFDLCHLVEIVRVVEKCVVA